MNYRGSCHCGRIAYDVEGEIGDVISCNCSMCQRKGALMWFVPRDRLQLRTKPEDMSTYLFNKHVIKHYFCPKCGTAPFSEGKGPDGSAMAAVNVRCIEDIDLEKLKVKHYNGRTA